MDILHWTSQPEANPNCIFISVDWFLAHSTLLQNILAWVEQIRIEEPGCFGMDGLLPWSRRRVTVGWIKLTWCLCLMFASVCRYFFIHVRSILHCLLILTLVDKLFLHWWVFCFSAHFTSVFLNKTRTKNGALYFYSDLSHYMKSLCCYCFLFAVALDKKRPWFELWKFR